jgi:hypothetical protein
VIRSEEKTVIGGTVAADRSPAIEADLTLLPCDVCPLAAVMLTCRSTGVDERHMDSRKVVRMSKPIGISLIVALCLLVVWPLSAAALGFHRHRRVVASHHTRVVSRHIVRDGMLGVSLAAELANLREINYYPAGGGWTYMWTGWNQPAIERDLGRMRSLSANTVRIFVFPSVFGYPTPSTQMLSRLQAFVGEAAAQGLGVHLTLFDWWNNYGDVSGSETWAGDILRSLMASTPPTVVELQNEIDPTNPAAMAWARTMIPYVRSILGGVPVTISVSGARGAPGLAALHAALGNSQPDSYSLHFYGNPAAAYATFKQAIATVAPTPLFVGEFGASSASAQGVVAGAASQDLALRTVASAAIAAGLPAPAPWTLNDFASSAIPPSGTANTSSDYSMGLYATSGAAKPSATSIAQLFHSRLVATDFNAGFEASYPAASSPTGLLPTDWGLFDPSAATFALDPSVAHSGSASARISDSGGTSLQVPAFFISPPQAWVIPGKSYSLSAWAKGSAATGSNRIAIAWFAADGRYLGEAESQSLRNGTTHWTVLTVSATAPPGAAFVELHLKSEDNTGTVWYDDVRWSG